MQERIVCEPKPLSKEQRLAVISDERYIRVIAGAGAGKTETLTRRIAYLLLVKHIEPSSIVAFTFTEKAAQSMKSRVYERVRHLGGDEICSRLGEMFVGTIHAYCARILEERFGYGNYSVLDDNQEMAFLLRVGWDLGLGEHGNYANNCVRFLEALNVVYGELLTDEQLKLKAPSLLQKKLVYERHLDQSKQLTFNLMVHHAIQHLIKTPDVTDIRHLIVDEYQDINRAQEKLIDILGKNGSIFIVGDPRQTIYQWRGSDEKCFDDFAEKRTGVETIPIVENRRSTKCIVNVANHFSDTLADRYDHMVSMRGSDTGAYYSIFPTVTDEVKWISDQIESYISKGKCNYGDLALLFRSVNTSAPPFIDEFRDRGIPFVVGGKVGLFRREEIQALGMIFSWAYDDGFWQTNHWSKTDRIHGDDLRDKAIGLWLSFVPGAPDRDTCLKCLNKWKDDICHGAFENFTSSYYGLLAILNYQNLDPQDPEHAVIMANVGRFGSVLTDYETANMLGGRRRNWSRDLKGLCWYMNSYASSSYDEQTAEDQTGINAVSLMTIHQAKGLEWPLVFIPSMVQGRFPSTMVGRQQDWLLPRDIFNVNKYEGDLDSERKLFYVALTRAKDVVVVSSFNHMNGRNKSVSEFIEDMVCPDISDLRGKELPVHDITARGDSEELLTFAPGEIVAYERCPHHYRLQFVWGYQPGLSEYLGYGNALHFCLRRTAELIKEGLTPMGAVATSVDRYFFMPFMEENRASDIKGAAKKHLIRFTQRYNEDMLRIKEVETRIEFPLQNAVVAGKVDVILHDGDKIEVREYKTSDSVATKDDVSIQLRLYARGLRTLGEEVSKGSVAFLEEASVEPVDLGDQATNNTINRVENSIKNILDHKYTPTPGEFCTKCDYGSICRWKAS